MESPPRLGSRNYVDDAWHRGSKRAVEGQPKLCLGVAASPPLNRAVPERKEKEESKSKEKEKEKEENKSKENEKSKKPWTSRLVLGAAATVGVVAAVVAGASIVLSAIGDSMDQEEEDDPSKKTMKAPGSGGRIIDRSKFKKKPKEYFHLLRKIGSKDAVDPFQ